MNIVTPEQFAALPPIQADAEMDAYLAGFDKRHANDKCIPANGTARLLAAYNRYIEKVIEESDGIPEFLTFAEWKAANTTELPATETYDSLSNVIRPKAKSGSGKRGVTNKKRIRKPRRK